ncbi:hypothetical protein GUJ93_ZPchr0458g22512 [Zizania palustris]|uniref:Uncharacterized protein n=1 Tax=Zizania palustris TaxID=103762 RepID=A0A8J5RL09_ZIZPA|nr:hypothetical protein GUJ93_ZPchr0458g22512 [Zizania palustris]
MAGSALSARIRRRGGRIWRRRLPLAGFCRRRPPPSCLDVGVAGCRRRSSPGPSPARIRRRGGRSGATGLPPLGSVAGATGSGATGFPPPVSPPPSSPRPASRRPAGSAAADLPPRYFTAAPPRTRRRGGRIWRARPSLGPRVPPLLPLATTCTGRPWGAPPMLPTSPASPGLGGAPLPPRHVLADPGWAAALLPTAVALGWLAPTDVVAVDAALAAALATAKTTAAAGAREGSALAWETARQTTDAWTSMSLRRASPQGC